MNNSAKVVPAVIEFVDIAGLVKGASKGEGLGNQFLSNIREVQSRGASVVLFVRESISMADAEYADVLLLPDMADEFMVFPAAAALQLLAYYVSMDRGLDVDKPRNLAKVVTVE